MPANPEHPAGTTFCVCAMVREDADILVRFSDYYLDLGAQEVLLFYDGIPPEDPRLDRPNLTLVACDDSFWAAQPERVRPRSVDAAQGICYRVARQRSTADWLWITDADEFLIAPTPVSDLLAAIPADVSALRIPTAEAVWGPGDDPDKDFGCTYFRRPVPRRIAAPLTRLLYGRTAVFYRAGLLAHSVGKHFVRRESDVTRIGNHVSYRDEIPVGVWARDITPRGTGFHVAHFDAIGFARWHEKWRRRYSDETETLKMHPVRHAQKRMVQQASREGERALRDLFRRLNVLAPWQAAVLRTGGVLFRRDIFAEAATAPADPPRSP